MFGRKKSHTRRAHHAGHRTFSGRLCQRLKTFDQICRIFHTVLQNFDLIFHPMYLYFLQGFNYIVREFFRAGILGHGSQDYPALRNGADVQCVVQFFLAVAVADMGQQHSHRTDQTAGVCVLPLCRG